MKKLILVIAVLLFASCATRYKHEPRIVHVVMCWLNEPGNQKHQEMIVQASREFRKIPGVIDVGVGGPLMSERPIVDDSFDVGIFLTFKNEADLQLYLDHPDHVAAVKVILKPLVKTIKVYDIIDK